MTNRTGENTVLHNRLVGVGRSDDESPPRVPGAATLEELLEAIAAAARAQVAVLNQRRPELVRPARSASAGTAPGSSGAVRGDTASRWEAAERQAMEGAADDEVVTGAG